MVGWSEVSTVLVDTIKPTIANGSAHTLASVEENSALGTLIYTANVTDANSISLSLSGADQDQFEIDQNGKITIKKNLVWDNGNTGLYYFTVNATDVAGNISKQDLTLEVTEQIVSKPSFPKKSNGFVSSNRPPISGNAPNGSTIEIYNDQNQLIPRLSSGWILIVDCYSS